MHFYLVIACAITLLQNFFWPSLRETFVLLAVHVLLRGGSCKFLAGCWDQENLGKSQGTSCGKADFSISYLFTSYLRDWFVRVFDRGKYFQRILGFDNFFLHITNVQPKGVAEQLCWPSLVEEHDCLQLEEKNLAAAAANYDDDDRDNGFVVAQFCRKAPQPMPPRLLSINQYLPNFSFSSFSTSWSTI